MILRRETKQIHVGDVAVGGGSPISVQSMTNTDTRDVEETAAQIERLQDAGCEIVRVAVLDKEYSGKDLYSAYRRYSFRSSFGSSLHGKRGTGHSY